MAFFLNFFVFRRFVFCYAAFSILPVGRKLHMLTVSTTQQGLYHVLSPSTWLHIEIITLGQLKTFVAILPSAFLSALFEKSIAANTFKPKRSASRALSARKK